MLSLYRLPNQLPNEKILKVLHRDLFILFQKVLIFIVLIIIPFGFFTIMTLTQPGFMLGEISFPFLVLGTSAYYLFAWLFFFFLFIDYYLDTWIITSERIINIEQRGFFSRVISEQRLANVQDVTSDVQGFLPTFFRYGNVQVQTAGEQPRFNFMEVPNPEEVRNLIIKQSEVCKVKRRGI